MQRKSLGQEDPLGGGNGNPLLYSCLGNPIERAAWHATVRGVTESPTQLMTKHICTQGCCNKLPQTGLKQQKYILVQFWRTDIQNQDVRSAMIPLRPWVEAPSAFSQHLSLVFLELPLHPSSLCFHHRRVTSLCVCISFLLVPDIVGLGAALIPNLNLIISVKTYFQIRSYAQVLWVGSSPYSSEDKIQASTCCHHY